MLITSYIFIIFYSFIFQIPALIALGTFIAGLFSFFYLNKISFSSNYLALSIITFFICIPAFFKLFHGWTPLFYLFSTLITIVSVSKILTNPDRIILKAIRIIYSSFILFIIYLIIINRNQIHPFEEAMPGTSTNGIPSYLIILQSSLSIFNYRVNNKLPYFSPLITFIVCIIGIGRSSLVISFLILIGTFYFNFITSRNKINSKSLLISFVIIIGIYFLGLEVYENIFRITKLSAGFELYHRSKLLNAYLNNMNFIDLIIGKDYSGSIIEFVYYNNPHNSLIRAHSYMGLPYFLTIILSPFIIIFQNYNYKYKIMITFFSLALIARSFTDPILFPTLLDFFYFLNIFPRQINI